jgi:uncharacterized protein with HEPN domain
MRRDPRAFLLDIMEACEAIADAVAEIALDHYRTNRLVRSSVEREFIIIGEALTNLSRIDPQLFEQVEAAPQIISFRNKLTHEYSVIDHELVWGVIHKLLPPLRDRCSQLLQDPTKGSL